MVGLGKIFRLERSAVFTIETQDGLELGTKCCRNSKNSFDNIKNCLQVTLSGYTYILETEFLL